MMDQYSRVVIIGAGPAGLATAISLKQNALILERQSELGGLSRSIEIEGAIFDLGGHSFHTPHPHVRNLVFNALEMEEQPRDARCYSYGNLIPYPFQKNFHLIKNEQVVSECQEGLATVNSGNKPANFEEYILNSFGNGISQHFMLPYNRKLWGRDLKRLTADWVEERVAAPVGIQEKFDQLGGKRKPLQEKQSVAYPKQGGFDEIFKALGKQVHDIRYNTNVSSIDPERKCLTTESGDIYRWDYLVSTLPLPVLLHMLPNVPLTLQQQVAALETLSLKVVMLVINHPVDVDVQRIYSADWHIAAHKIAINHNSSDYLRARPTHGIMAEISYSDDKPLVSENIVATVIENLCELGMIKDSNEVIASHVEDIKYGYPVPTHNRKDTISVVQQWLEAKNIFTLGRFGEWAYINSDEALNRGMILGYSLLNKFENEAT